MKLQIGALLRLSAMVVLALTTAATGAAGQDNAPALPPGQVRPVVAADSADARAVIDRARDKVVQIRTFFGTNSAPLSHGSALAVGDALFVTNFHVVSDHVFAPKRNRVEYRTSDGATSGAVTVIAVDVRNDLALVEAQGLNRSALPLQVDIPAKGARAYSVGFPLDVGLTITEGVSNGMVDNAFEPRIHYSGPLNGGMSGGPGLNAAGEVIGVNVSGYFLQQSVAFFVPAAKVADLLASRRLNKPSSDDLKQDIAKQMRDHSTSLLSALSGTLKTEKSNGYVLPAKLAPFIDCNASGNQSQGQPYETVRVKCDAKASVFLERGHQTGDLNYTHVLLSTNKLGAWRFAKVMGNHSTASGFRGAVKHVGPLTCQQRDVALKGFAANTLLCTRSYRKFEGLYDFVLQVMSLDGADQGFISHLDLFAVDYAKGLDFIGRYIGAMEKAP